MSDDYICMPADIYSLAVPVNVAPVQTKNTSPETIRMKTVFCLLLIALFAASEAKVFTKCELAQVLKNGGLDGYYGYSLANWMCLAYYESRYTTNAVNDNGWSTDYGIFQINSYWWCNDGNTSGAIGGCNISCNSLMNDDITDDITCAKRVVRDPNGMGAWVAWNNYCKNKDLSSFVSGCAL
ncbi:lysozyme C-1-like [Rana temporaria]|uniref:lysozyme C-1-like n=1 Tax=Rana temporaria TaxID=8407 RepID=UPI001AAE11A8|nr:lysozyme C-1-like [Rana temporaria]